MRMHPYKKTEKNTRMDEDTVATVLRDNEKRANRLAVYIFITGVAVLSLTFLLNVLGLFKLTSVLAPVSYLAPGIMCLIPILARRVKGFSQRTLKWINLFCIVAFSAWINFTVNYYAVLFMAVPIVLAVVYFSEKTTVITYAATVISYGFTTYWGAQSQAVLDLNHVSVPSGTVFTVSGSLKQTLLEAGFRNAQYTGHMMLFEYFPSLLSSLLLIVLAIAITRFGYDMLIRQARDAAERARTGAELKLAGDLQANVLPQVSAINGKYNFELAAGMHPAREACGDFYDFTMIDDTHLALVVADVCGKGIPAAMLMMSAKERLRGAFAPGRTPGEILYEVNNDLYENNTKRMFVTVWLGIIDITTGKLVSANGGHEDPIGQKAAGVFSVLPENHGIALGVRKNRSFPEQELQLEPGDVLIQYTDGVTEARNTAGDMYGTERFLTGLNERLGGTRSCAEAIDKELHAMIAGFVGNAEQADDITTLVLRYL